MRARVHTYVIRIVLLSRPDVDGERAAQLLPLLLQSVDPRSLLELADVILLDVAADQLHLRASARGQLRVEGVGERAPEAAHVAEAVLAEARARVGHARGQLGPTRARGRQVLILEKEREGEG